MTAEDKIYLTIQIGDHFYDESEDRHIDITGVYKDSKTASATVTEYNYYAPYEIADLSQDVSRRYSQTFTFRELSHFEKEDRYNDGSTY